MVPLSELKEFPIMLVCYAASLLSAIIIFGGAIPETNTQQLLFVLAFLTVYCLLIFLAIIAGCADLRFAYRVVSRYRVTDRNR